MALRKLLAAVLAAAVIGAVAAPAAHAAEFEGVVIAKSDKAKTFTLRQDEGGGTFKIKVNADTTYRRLSGFGAIKVGARNIERPHASPARSGSLRWSRYPAVAVAAAGTTVPATTTDRAARDSRGAARRSAGRRPL